LHDDCIAFASGRPETYPGQKQRRSRPHKHGTAYWIERSGQIWLVRRAAKGMLGGMAALPGSGWSDEPNHEPASIATVRHMFTHFTLDLHVVRRFEPVGDGWWQPVDTLAGAGLPTLYRRAVEAALDAAAAPRAAA
jgi:A/G-specific adenine glycosylase